MSTFPVNRIFPHRIESYDSFGSCSSDNHHLELAYWLIQNAVRIARYHMLIRTLSSDLRSKSQVKHIDRRPVSHPARTIRIHFRAFRYARHPTRICHSTSTWPPFPTVWLTYRNSKSIANRRNGHPLTNSMDASFDRFRSNQERMIFRRGTQ